MDQKTGPKAGETIQPIPPYRSKSDKPASVVNEPETVTDGGTRTKKFRVLSIDGGGIRGIIPSIVLQYLEKKSGKAIHELFDLISGTSTGAILATLLTLPTSAEDRTPRYSAIEASEMYYSQGAKIFSRGSAWSRMVAMKGLNRSIYSGKGKRAVIGNYVDDLKLTDALTDLVVPAFDVHQGVPYFFSSSCAKADSKCDYPLLEVLDSTSSAPTYFPPVRVFGYDAPTRTRGKSKLEGYRSFVDGGIVANSPVLCALAEAKKHLSKDQEIVLVSLGTGDQTGLISHDKVRKWGALSWASYFPNSLISASMYTADFQCKHALPEGVGYFRFQARIEKSEHAAMDDITESNIRWLKNQGLWLVESEKARLDKICDLLLQ